MGFEGEVSLGIKICLVLRREWGNGLWGPSLGIVYRDPFPHSLL